MPTHQNQNEDVADRFLQVSKKKKKMRGIAPLLIFLSVDATVVTADAFVPSQRVTTLAKVRSVKQTTSLKCTIENDNETESDGISSVDDIPRGGGASIKKSPPELPSLATYRKFALPCLGLWVAQPLLSLVDTAFVGLSLIHI